MSYSCPSFCYGVKESRGTGREQMYYPVVHACFIIILYSRSFLPYVVSLERRNPKTCLLLAVMHAPASLSVS